MKRGLLCFGLILWTECFLLTVVLPAAETQKLKIIYSSFTGAYTPLWIAVDEQLGRKHGLDLEAVYAGRARPHQLLLSGDAQYVVSTGTGVVSSYAVGQKDMVIIASFLNVTGSSLFTKPQISKPAELRGKVVGSGRPGSITDVMLHYMLKKLNLDLARDVRSCPWATGRASCRRWKRSRRRGGADDADAADGQSRGFSRDARLRRARHSLSIRRGIDAQGEC
jgi:ABC-type nitrate/sulfonate/bicarbonate transport system substrate-binding protein